MYPGSAWASRLCRPVGADVNVRLGSTAVRIQIYDKSGITIGNVLITDEDRRGDGPLLDHELFHTFKWAGRWSAVHRVVRGRVCEGCECNRFEEAAGFVVGPYEHCAGCREASVGVGGAGSRVNGLFRAGRRRFDVGYEVPKWLGAVDGDVVRAVDLPVC